MKLLILALFCTTVHTSEKARGSDDTVISYISPETSVSIGQTLELLAIVDSLGSGTVSWVRQPGDQVLTLGSQIVVYDPRLSVDHKANSNRYALIIKHIRHEDATRYYIWVDLDNGHRRLVASVEVYITGSVTCEFRCADGSCVRYHQRCNGQPDCPDETDEVDCRGRDPLTCEFQCADGSCVRYHQRCNGQPDCPDETDEVDCRGRDPVTCEFRCADGNCVRYHQRCNGHPDCPDGTDEVDCRHHDPVTCEFQCADGSCVRYDQRCNGHRDCPDGTDEVDCRHHDPVTCEFQCADGSCVRYDQRCNGHPDCPDGTDEVDCHDRDSDAVISYISPETTVAVGQTLELVAVVDSLGTGTVSWVRQPGDQVLTSGSIIMVFDPRLSVDHEANSNRYALIIKDIRHEDATRYDVWVDIGHRRLVASVEVYITGSATCEFRCADGSCVRYHQRCNGQPDCPDGTDEVDCRGLCKEGDLCYGFMGVVCECEQPLVCHIPPGSADFGVCKKVCAKEGDQCMNTEEDRIVCECGPDMFCSVNVWNGYGVCKKGTKPDLPTCKEGELCRTNWGSLCWCDDPFTCSTYGRPDYSGICKKY